MLRNPLSPWLCWTLLSSVTVLGALASACASKDTPSNGSSGGATVTGGSSATGGSGGANSSGGATSSGGSTSNGGATSASGGASSTGGAATQLFGGFVVSLVAADETVPAYTSVLGRFFDGPTPPTIPLKLSKRDGACELLVPHVPFCSNTCTGGAVCTEDEVCTPKPNVRDVGPVEVHGLGASVLSLKPGAGSAYQPSASLPNPPCQVGDEITVEASTLQLRADCIAPLSVTSAQPIPVKSGSAVPLTWTPAAANSSSTIRIKLDLAHHGGKKGEINCEVPDSGAFEIPEPLITELVRLGLAGFPTIGINRVSVGKPDATPNVSLLISSFVELPVDTGVMSCISDDECGGKTCGPDKVCH